MKKNAFIDQLLDKLADGEKLTDEADPHQGVPGPGLRQIRLHLRGHALHDAEKAAALAQQLSMAGINELYITGEWSNWFEAWMALDSFGLKLRGICQIKNADYYQDIEKWGDSDRPSDLTALKFSFEEESK